MKCAGCDNEVPPNKAPGRARKWCSERCRKRTLYSRRCIDCGAVCNTDGSVTEPSLRCQKCNGAHTRALTRAWVIKSMQEWARMFGAPPSATDWNRARLKDKSMTRKADRYEKTGRPWPSAGTVQQNFGSWNAGLIAAGFLPLTPSEHPIGHAGAALKRRDLFGTSARPTLPWRTASLEDDAELEAVEGSPPPQRYEDSDFA